jgi:histidine triad (HIT) family protein
MEDDLLEGLMAFAKKVAKGIKKTVPCRRIGIMVAGIEVPHAHVHLIPINGVGDLNFAHAKATPNEELAAMAEKIRSNLK